jgi:hypothetical protein
VSPKGDPRRLSSEAMELAIEELVSDLPCESQTADAGIFSLDEAMNHLRRHTPPA